MTNATRAASLKEEARQRLKRGLPLHSSIRKTAKLKLISSDIPDEVIDVDVSKLSVAPSRVRGDKPVQGDVLSQSDAEIGTIIPFLSLLRDNDAARETVVTDDANKLAETSQADALSKAVQTASSAKTEVTDTSVLSLISKSLVDAFSTVTPLASPYYMIYRVFVAAHAAFSASIKLMTGGDPALDAFIQYCAQIGISGSTWNQAVGNISKLLTDVYANMKFLNYWDGAPVNESAKTQVIANRIVESLKKYVQNAPAGSKYLNYIIPQLSDALMVNAYSESSFLRSKVSGPSNERRLGYWHLQEWIAKAYTTKDWKWAFDAASLVQPAEKTIRPDLNDQYLSVDEEVAFMTVYFVDMARTIENKVELPPLGTPIGDLKFKGPKGELIVDKDFPQSGNFYYDMIYLSYYYHLFGRFGVGSDSHVKVLSRKQFNYILLRIAKTYAEARPTLAAQSSEQGG